MNDDNLLKLENMLNGNIYIKELMYGLAPREEYFASSEIAARYSDRFLSVLDKIKKTFLKMLEDYPVFELDKEKLEALFLKMEKDVLNAYENPAMLKTLFEKNISNMRVDFVDFVSKNYVGYSFFGAEGTAFPTTINELLHMHHSATINNEHTFKSMQLVKKKKPPEGSNMQEKKTEGIEYYGMENEMSDNIYDILYNIMYNSSKYDRISSIVHLVSLKNKAIVMLRDLGHATVMEINYNDTSVEIRYYIPKICNYEMVQKLPGVTYISGDAVNDIAKGSFVIKKEDFSRQFEELLNGIPMGRNIDFNNIKVR